MTVVHSSIPPPTSSPLPPQPRCNLRRTMRWRDDANPLTISAAWRGRGHGHGHNTYTYIFSHCLFTYKSDASTSFHARFRHPLPHACYSRPFHIAPCQFRNPTDGTRRASILCGQTGTARTPDSSTTCADVRDFPTANGRTSADSMEHLRLVRCCRNQTDPWTVVEVGRFHRSPSSLQQSPTRHSSFRPAIYRYRQMQKMNIDRASVFKQSSEAGW